MPDTFPHLSFLSIADVARYLDCSYSQSWRLIHSGRIRSTEIAGKTVVSREALDEYRQQRAEDGGS